MGRGQVHLEEALSSPRNQIQSSENHPCRLTKRFSIQHIGEYNASHYWIFYQNKKQMCRMLRIINTFQKNNFRRSWKILHGTSWFTFGFPRLFLYWYLWKCVNVFQKRYLPQKNTFENGYWYSAQGVTFSKLVCLGSKLALQLNCSWKLVCLGSKLALQLSCPWNSSAGTPSCSS